MESQSLKGAAAGTPGAKMCFRLTLQRQKRCRQSCGSPVRKADGKSDGKLLSGAAFVLKNEDGQIIRDEKGYPKYYISFNGEEVSINGLEAGTYLLSEISAPKGYQPAADRKFAIEADAAAPVELIVSNAKTASDAQTLELTAQSTFNQTVLTSRI